MEKRAALIDSKDRFVLALMILTILIFLITPGRIFTNLSDSLTGSTVTTAVASNVGGNLWQQLYENYFVYVLIILGLIVLFLLVVLFRSIIKKEKKDLSEDNEDNSFEISSPPPKVRKIISPLKKSVPMETWKGKKELSLAEELSRIDSELENLQDKEPERVKKLTVISSRSKETSPHPKVSSIDPPINLFTKQKFSRELSYLDDELRAVDKASLEKYKAKTVTPPTLGHSSTESGTRRRWLNLKKLFSFRKQDESGLKLTHFQKVPERGIPVQKEEAVESLEKIPLPKKIERRPFKEKEVKPIKKVEKKRLFEKKVILHEEKVKPIPRKKPLVNEKPIQLHNTEEIVEEIEELLHDDFT